MLEMIMDRHLQFVLLGAVASIGLISKIITGVTLKKLVWAAANIGEKHASVDAPDPGKI